MPAVSLLALLLVAEARALVWRSWTCWSSTEATRIRPGYSSATVVALAGFVRLVGCTYHLGGRFVWYISSLRGSSSDEDDYIGNRRLWESVNICCYLSRYTERESGKPQQPRADVSLLPPTTDLPSYSGHVDHYKIIAGAF